MLAAIDPLTNLPRHPDCPLHRLPKELLFHIIRYIPPQRLKVYRLEESLFSPEPIVEDLGNLDMIDFSQGYGHAVSLTGTRKTPLPSLFSLILSLASGQVMTMGVNRYGQCGRASRSLRQDEFFAVELPPALVDRHITQVLVGWYYTLIYVQ